MTSRRKPKEVKQIKNVLERCSFPDGRLLFREKGEEYKDVAERIIPDVLIEDDCESIGGKEEMTITHNGRHNYPYEFVMSSEYSN